MLQRVLFELGYSFDKQQQRLENRQQQQRWLQLWQLLEDQKRFEEKKNMRFNKKKKSDAELKFFPKSVTGPQCEWNLI